MKCLFSFLLFLLVLPSIGLSQTEVRKPIVIMGEWMPIPDYFYMVENVYLARVTAVHGHNLTFTVTDTLRGKSQDILHLHLDDGTVTAGKLRSYNKDSEWLLGQTGSKYINGFGEDTVGWHKIGISGWLPTPIIRTGQVIYVQDVCDEGGEGVQEKAPDGTVGVTLDHVKRLLLDHPYKP